MEVATLGCVIIMNVLLMLSNKVVTNTLCWPCCDNTSIYVQVKIQLLIMPHNRISVE